ncbi:hypothetical protein UCDDA912_g01778 [Diaporthe ampelina]|uniref:Uncharacterized protein n=1 Tax=Diaporthe ampelina TaxID=1214573 RepID=A0A0G2IEN3_9PEZI|nr:hypothetical protein UCDDA912_g01778 [Diaporthe ampelina]
MPDSSNPPTQSPANSASSAEFSAKVEEKIISYMWYIHVMVRVNAADRLRDRIAEYLEQGTTTTTRAPTSPPYSPPFDLDGINHAGGGGGSSSSSTFGHEGDIAGAASRMDNLVDYLVLRLFSRVMLEALIHTAPIDEHTDGYARVLAGIPAHFRDEFCRRLYRLLFSKYILEWPRGIAVPDPGPGSIADADAAAAAAAAANAGSKTVVSGGRRSSVHIPRDGDNDDKEDEFMFNMDNIMTNEERDDIFDGEKYKHPVNQEPESPGYQSTLGPSSPWPDTPSLGNSPELARAAYFGTS